MNSITKKQNALTKCEKPLMSEGKSKDEFKNALINMFEMLNDENVVNAIRSYNHDPRKVKIVLTKILQNTPALAMTTKESFMIAFLNALSLEVDISPLSKLIYFIPKKIKIENKKNNTKWYEYQTTLRLDYKVHKILLRRAGINMSEHLVYFCDKFDFESNNGLDKYYYKPNLEKSLKFRTGQEKYENMMGVLVNFFRDNKSYGSVFIDRNEIEEIMKGSDFCFKKDHNEDFIVNNNGFYELMPNAIWYKWFKDMALGKAIRKAIHRSAFAMDKDNSQLYRAINLDIASENGELLEKLGQEARKDLEAKKEIEIIECVENDKIQKKISEIFVCQNTGKVFDISEVDDDFKKNCLNFDTLDKWYKFLSEEKGYEPLEMQKWEEFSSNVKRNMKEFKKITNCEFIDG